MVRFDLNGAQVEAREGQSLLDYLRGEARLTGAKNACGEGACGACSVIVDGALSASCLLPIERVAGRKVLTVEGLAPAEMDLYTRAFADAGAVQCGFCTPAMVLAAKVLLDHNADPDEAEIRRAIRRNICRCTGYAKIVDAVRLAARRKRAPAWQGVVTQASGVGGRLPRVDAEAKARGTAKYTDDLAADGMLVGAALRSPHPRARLLSLDVDEARRLPGVACVATWKDIPGERFIGHLVSDWPTLVAVGEVTRYVGDAVALVAADTIATARRALALIRAEYEVLAPVASPEEALAPGAPSLSPDGNVLSRLLLKRGDARAALDGAAHVVEARFTTPFTDHAFMEPESALAFPPDSEGNVRVLTGEQSVFDGRRYVARTLGIPLERVRIHSSYVGGAFGGKEDQTVQHTAALLAWLTGRPVKQTLGRAESTRVHVKRHAMTVSLRVGCDARGRIVGCVGTIVADTGAYASLGGPVLHRAVTHAGGPYAYEDIEIEGIAVYTNNPPAGAFRGFGVPQATFAMEGALDRLARKAGISPWEIRMRNAVRPGDHLPNGQVAGPDTALEECLLAVKDAFEGAPGRAGMACAFKNTGLGMGHRDVGRCVVGVMADYVEVRTGAGCVGQGLATVLTQIACQVLGLEPEQVRVVTPDTDATPDSGTATASRHTLITGEACRRACADLAEAARRAEIATVGDGFPFAALAGREFSAEYEAVTDPFDSRSTEPVHHVAYSYACQVVILGPDGRVERVVAAHDSGLVVNPMAFEGPVAGGVVMGLGYALTESLRMERCVPTARYGQLGLLRAPDAPPIETIIVRKEGSGSALDGGVSGAAYGAKGIGEISTIPTAAAVASAYYAFDGVERNSLPLAGTPYGAAATPAAR